MTIEKSPPNVRCDKAFCKNYASYNINTSGHKGNIALCEDCFNKLYDAICKLKKEIKQKDKLKK